MLFIRHIKFISQKLVNVIVAYIADKSGNDKCLRILHKLTAKNFWYVF